MMALFERQQPVAPHSPSRPRIDLQLPVPEERTLNTDRVRAIARSYFNIHLTKLGYRAQADQLANTRGLNRKIHNSMKKIQERLENDISEQFIDILGPLFVTNVNQEAAKSKYDSVAVTVFSDAVNWGRLLTFLRFSVEFAVRCMQTPVKITISEVLDWTEEKLVTIFPLLIESDPEIARMLVSDTEWNIDMSAIAFTTGLAVVVVTAGLFALKRILTH